MITIPTVLVMIFFLHPSILVGIGVVVCTLLVDTVLFS